ncbi:MAG: vWA domain-containing protein [Planctomycetota bacterium]
MTFSRSALSCVLATVALATAVTAHADEPLSAWVHEDANGVRRFAASLPPVAEQQPSAPAEVVVLVDTSASQVGMYRETALAATEALLATLEPGARVHLMAADLDARILTTEPIGPNTREAELALDALRGVAPLGATDLAAAISMAEVTLTDAPQGARKAIVYIGDGMHLGGQSMGGALGEAIDAAIDARVAITSYAIGPRYDASLLAAIANQTGGNLYVDLPMSVARDGVSEQRAREENQARGARIGRTLAVWAQGVVEWPADVMIDGVVELYPESAPRRADRDTIVVGTIDPNTDTVAVTLDGVTHRTAVPASDDTYAYLVDLVDSAERDGGRSLTTLGSAGLEVTGRNLLAGLENLTELAERAVAMGDADSATQITDAVLRRDPGNPRALTVQALAEQRADEGDVVRTAQLELGEPIPSGDSIIMTREAPGGDFVAPPLVDGAGPNGVIVEPGLAQGYVDEGFYPPSEVVVDGRFLSSVERNRRVYAQMLEKEVQTSIADARSQMATNPTAAMQRLKLTMQSVDRAPELIAAVRAGLVDRLRSAMREAARQEAIVDDLQRERQEALAAARERRLLLDRLDRKREREKQLIERFQALVDEGMYAEAERVALIAEELEPDGVVPRVARVWGQAKRYHEFNQEYRKIRAAAALDVLAQVEKSFVPFPDDPPIVYPDVETWSELTERRKKYSSVDLAGQSESEEAITSALAGPLTSAGLDFEDTALEEIVTFLREEYEIEMQLDEVGLDDVGLAPDEPISVNLRNISLRSALRLMLKPLELTYVISDEVLLITSEDEALNRLSVKVYPVADLVLPIITPQGGGGMGGGMGGGGMGGGGMGGGGMGGGGMGGGGMGGGGMGGGGMGGGAFAVPDEPAALTLTRVEPAANAAETPAVEPVSVEPQRALESDDIRPLVRELIATKRFAEAADAIQEALQAGNAEPWMYESLGIALELAGRSSDEVERALMSAVDFATSGEQLLAIARYLVGGGHDARAVDVCRLALAQDSTLVDAITLAFRAARRADDVDGLGWATVEVLSRTWPREQAAVQDAASAIAETIAVRLAPTKAERFREKLAAAKRRDCVVTVSWVGDADVDLAVQEPGGSICWVGHPVTAAGGVSLANSSALEEDALHSESYECSRAFAGKYRVSVKKAWGEVTADMVNVSVTLAAGSDAEETISEQLTLGETGEVVIDFEMAEGRRDEPVEGRLIAGAIQRQQAMGRAVLAQQIDSLAGDGPVSLRPDDIRRRRLALARAGQGVGFQPVIITLPEGTNMSASAVVSADRRYVRVTPVPFFSSIPAVSTFSFVGSPAALDDGQTGQNNTVNAPPAGS